MDIYVIMQVIILFGAIFLGVRLGGMGNGTQLEADGVSIRTDVPADVLLLKQDGKWMYTATAPCRVVVERKNIHFRFQKSYVF